MKTVKSMDGESTEIDNDPKESRKSLSDIVFEEKLKVYSRFKASITGTLSENPQERRLTFINWYLKEYAFEPIEKNIQNLSNYFLYLSEKRIEAILFYDEK